MLGARPLRRRQRVRGIRRTKIRVPNTKPPQGPMTTASANHGCKVPPPGQAMGAPYFAESFSPLPGRCFRWSATTAVDPHTCPLVWHLPST
jgi:hypothetical protein